jgi:hypothetical protein
VGESETGGESAPRVLGGPVWDREPVWERRSPIFCLYQRQWLGKERFHTSPLIHGMSMLRTAFSKSYAAKRTGRSSRPVTRHSCDRCNYAPCIHDQ